MRKREALKLTWDRVDFKTDVIKLGALAKDGQVDTKAKQARIVPISPRLKASLLAIWQREKGGKISRITDRVFLFRGNLSTASTAPSTRRVETLASKACGFMIFGRRSQRGKSLKALIEIGSR
jgi:integrase